MIFLIILILIIIALLYVLQKRKKERMPIRLKKQITLAEKIQNFINKYYHYLFIIAIIIALILFIVCVMAFVPGTESGIWYNGGVENVVS